MQKRSQRFLADVKDSVSNSSDDDTTEVAAITAGRQTSKSRRTEGTGAGTSRTKTREEGRSRQTGDRSKSRNTNDSKNSRVSRPETPDAEFDREEARRAKIEAEKQALIKHRKKTHKKKLKALKRELRDNMSDMEERLYDLQERYEDDGLDAVLADFDPSSKKPKQ